MNWIAESKKWACVFGCFSSFAYSNTRLAHTHCTDNLCFSFCSLFSGLFFRSHQCLRWSWLATQYVCIFRFSTQKIYRNATSMVANICECVWVFVWFFGVDLHPGGKKARDLTISRMCKKCTGSHTLVFTRHPTSVNNTHALAQTKFKPILIIRLLKCFPRFASNAICFILCFSSFT